MPLDGSIAPSDASDTVLAGLTMETELFWTLSCFQDSCSILMRPAATDGNYSSVCVDFLVFF